MKKWLILLAVVSVTTACTGTLFSGRKVSSTKPSGTQQNGDSYSGKTFENYLPAGETCADGSSLKAQILLSESTYKLTRDDCAELSPALDLDPASITVHSNGRTLVFAGESFFADFNPTCNYPELTLAVPAGEQCEATTRSTLSSVSGQSVSSGGRYRFEMYTPTAVARRTRVLTYQNVDVSAAVAPNSVDLLLYSYEPVRWVVRGNIAAVRSVRVQGYHCALVEGVASELVELSTEEQGASPNLGFLPLATVEAKTTNVYEGSCLANRAFTVE